MKKGRGRFEKEVLNPARRQSKKIQVSGDAMEKGATVVMPSLAGSQKVRL